MLRLDPDEYLKVGLEDTPSFPMPKPVVTHASVRRRLLAPLLFVLLLLAFGAAVSACGMYRVGMSLWTLLMP